jgi:hypothetical protein
MLQMEQAYEPDDRQMSLFSAPGEDFRRDLISSFSEPPSAFTYEPTDERRPQIRKALEDRSLVAVRQTDPSGGTRRFEKATGVSVVYFTGGQETLGGFTSKDTPDVIFIRSDRSDVPTAWLLAHELTHVAQKDKSVDTDGLLQQVKALLSKDEHGAILSKLEKNYPSEEWGNEITAHLMGEAVTGKNIFGLQDLANSGQISKILTDAFDRFPILKPETLNSAPDEQLSRLASAPQQSLLDSALAGMTPMHRQVFAASQATPTPTPAVIARRFSISEKAVENIIGQVRARLRTLSESTQPSGLDPATTRDGLLIPGRPERHEFHLISLQPPYKYRAFRLVPS